MNIFQRLECLCLASSICHNPFFFPSLAFTLTVIEVAVNDGSPETKRIKALLHIQPLEQMTTLNFTKRMVNLESFVAAFTAK